MILFAGALLCPGFPCAIGFAFLIGAVRTAAFKAVREVRYRGVHMGGTRGSKRAHRRQGES